MKKTILTFSLLVLMAGYSTSFAQNGKEVSKKERRAELSPEEIAKKKTDHMTKTLGLTKSQEEKMYDINLKHAKEQAALRNERKALKAKAEAEKQKHESEVDKILTEEQRAKLAAEKAQRAERKEKG
ncbi:MAG: hypothetical protein R3279_11735, partial [Putridiphycobacter sp.]|nr:hypothetical protein [Putridiphycobacter sp.]